MESTVFSGFDRNCFYVFLAFEFYFVSELALKFIAFQVNFFKEDRFNIIDLPLCAVCMLTQLTSLNFNVSVVRALRLVKLLRLIKFVNKLNMLDGLHVMITALRGSFMVLGWAIILLLVFQVSVALFLNQALSTFYIKVEEYPLEERQAVYEYFGTFARAFLSAFEMTLANWPPIARLLVENVSQWFILFNLFHKLTIGFAVVGVINGVFMQETFKVTANDDKLMLRQKQKAFAAHSAKMRKLLQAADQSGDGTVDLEEWREILIDPEVKTWLASMELVTNDADTLFHLIDASGTGTVDGEELINGVAKLKGYARSIDMHAVMLQIQQRPTIDDIYALLETCGIIKPIKDDTDTSKSEKQRASTPASTKSSDQRSRMSSLWSLISPREADWEL